MSSAHPDLGKDLSPEEIAQGDRVIAWLKQKWGPNWDCPYCGDVDWLVDPRPAPGPPLRNFHAVVCQNCGVLTFVSARVSGIEPLS